MKRYDDWVYASEQNREPRRLGVKRDPDSPEVREAIAIAGVAHGIERSRACLDELSDRLEEIRQLWALREDER